MSQELRSLKQQNAILRKVAKDNLGKGVWGLNKDNDKFSHEEIVFLFARVFPVFGIDYVKEVRTEFPDCVCMKDGEEITIEFEPILSSFADHIKKDDLSKCKWIVCWEDNLDLHNNIRDEIKNHNIKVIELKMFYEENRIKSRTRSFEWSRKEIGKLSHNRLKLLKAYISLGKDNLTKDEIIRETGISGKALGPVLGSYPPTKDWLIRHHPKGGIEFNVKYKKIVIDIIREFEI